MSVEETMRIFVGKAVKDEAALIEARTGFAITTDWLMQVSRSAATWRSIANCRRFPARRPRCARCMRRSTDALRSHRAPTAIKVELQLAKAGILDCFEGRIFSGHEMPRSKPFPDVYLAAAAALGMDPKRCAVIEDTVTGATAGIAAGATVFGYCPAELGHSSATALHGAGAAHVFRDMAELPALLARWCGGAR